MHWQGKRSQWSGKNAKEHKVLNSQNEVYPFLYWPREWAVERIDTIEMLMGRSEVCAVVTGRRVKVLKRTSTRPLVSKCLETGSTGR